MFSVSSTSSMSSFAMELQFYNFKDEEIEP